MRYSMFFALSFLLLMLGAPTSAEALVCDDPTGICDDINEVSDGWNAIANALEENAEDDLEDLDVESLVDDVKVLLEATELLGEALVEIGNEDEETLGRRSRSSVAVSSTRASAMNMPFPRQTPAPTPSR